MFGRLLDLIMARDLAQEKLKRYYRKGWHNLTPEEQADMEHQADRVQALGFEIAELTEKCKPQFRPA